MKALGAEADRVPELRAALESLCRDRGGEECANWAGKRLVRAALGREDGARVVRNPIRRDEAFTCAHCGLQVGPGGARVRDHCPACLRGLHVDRVPGDRAAGCGGLLEPVSFRLAGRAGVVVAWRCQRCGVERSGRAHPDDAVPPSLRAGDLPGGEDAGPARTLPLRVLDCVRSHRMWEPGDRVVLAVSGGVDSTVLLEVATRTRRAHGGELLVVSLDHGLRPEAAAEVAAVGERAAALGLAFRGVRIEVAPGPNLQARARDLRRAALLAVAAETGARRIATAHHADDQAETVLFHLLRGSGAAGLRGMRPLDPPWCRPLLRERRPTLEAWARAESLAWIEDPSNASSQRSRLREAIAALDALHGGAVEALARSARLLARDDACLEHLAGEEWARAWDGEGLALSALDDSDPAVGARLLRRLAAVAGLSVHADPIEAFYDRRPREGGRLPISGRWSFRLRGGRVVLEEG